MKLITLSLLLFPSLQQVFAYFLPHFNGRPVFPPHENVHRDLSAQSNVKPADYPEYQNPESSVAPDDLDAMNTNHVPASRCPDDKNSKAIDQLPQSKNCSAPVDTSLDHGRNFFFAFIQALTTTLSSSNFTAPTLTTNIYNFLLEIDRIPAANTSDASEHKCDTDTRTTNPTDSTPKNGFLVKPFAWMVEKDDASEEAQNPETSTDTKCESGSASQKVHDIKSMDEDEQTVILPLAHRYWAQKDQLQLLLFFGGLRRTR
ncbi:hypothetical protein MJO29_010074 [Puccinia striiformis f. sp. tritici]|uniref:hypothetical protein n=1 Tax=Puccinia striiformis f. sp. tritici TaxID=168172 RepID=UPI0020088BD0|nr:hypothetical protein Pst134EA_019129 [Puccinia striiformis f. sp. tritici]KAH9458975.1 hypothetical protein Pst134EA_019129 [Puccinia striiformis f. sp. tritici]KAI7948409.1 hypothetical protein MJO29_010074 [Puccinia striiformis f. sp. tritici]